MSGAGFKERWEQFMSDLRQQWVKFREAHLVQDEKYDGNAAGQLPRFHANTWGYSQTGQRVGAVVLPEPHGAVHAFTEISEGKRDTVGAHKSKSELVPTPRKDTTVGSTVPVLGGALLGRGATAVGMTLSRD
jgi:hypothetical protein